MMGALLQRRVPGPTAPPGSVSSLRAGGDRACSPKAVTNTQSGEVSSFWRAPTPWEGVQSFALQIRKVQVSHLRWSLTFR